MRSAAAISASKSVTDACIDGFKDSITALLSSQPIAPAAADYDHVNDTKKSYYSIVDGHWSPHFEHLTSRPLKRADTTHPTLLEKGIIKDVTAATCDVVLCQLTINYLARPGGVV